MGQEEEYERRVKDFEGYQVTNQLMGHADPGAVFLHCLPRHEEEVADEVNLLCLLIYVCAHTVGNAPAGALSGADN